MVKQKAIVDTCFLLKIADHGQHPDNIKKLLDNTNYIPVAHRYVVDHEFRVNSFLNTLIEEQYITTIEYDTFLDDKFSRDLYETSFFIIYNEMRDYMQRCGGSKQMPELNLPNGKTIYTHHLSKSSMGDVHMILMASFMRLPVFLSEDKDIDILKDIVKRRLNISTYELKIYNTFDLLKQVAKNTDNRLTHNEFKTIVKQSGERNNWSTINKSWKETHG